MSLVVLTKNRTLYVATPISGAEARVLRVRPPRVEGQPGDVSKLRGIIASVEPCSAGGSADVAYHLGEQRYALVGGTLGAPRKGLRMVVGGVECATELTTTVAFVETLPAEREWALRIMVRAHQEGDRLAHLLCFPQPWELVAEPEKTTYDRYRAYRAKVVTFPGDPLARGTSRTSLEEGILAAAGEGMEEVVHLERPIFSVNIRVKHRIVIPGPAGQERSVTRARRKELRLRPLGVRDEHRQALAATLDAVARSLLGAISSMAPEGMLRLQQPAGSELHRAA